LAFDESDTERLAPLCEPLHLVAEGLCSAKQFVGVEREGAIHEKNVEVVRRARCLRGIRLFHGDLVSVLDRGLGEGGAKRLCPAIVNLDLLEGPAGGIETLARTMSALNEFCPWPTMVVWNVIAARRFPSRDDFRAQFTKMKTHELFLGAVDRGGWEQYGELEYGGTGPRSATTMHTKVFWRAPG